MGIIETDLGRDLGFHLRFPSGHELQFVVHVGQLQDNKDTHKKDKTKKHPLASEHFEGVRDCMQGAPFRSVEDGQALNPRRASASRQVVVKETATAKSSMIPRHRTPFSTTIVYSAGHKAYHFICTGFATQPTQRVQFQG